MVAWPAAAFSSEWQEKAANANVLMIGAGGIGCELIKTLILSGFRKVTMVDMDTIEISNLNRQFLFRKRHVGKSKAEIAAEAVRSFCPEAKIVTLQNNVKESMFDMAFIKSFSIVLNGLDNDEARRHVNRLCLAADVPLVESGTTGYKGQATVHLKGKTECFECQPRPAPKGFPICTIRNTPEKPIHCIVWAKDLLFERLFGAPEETNDLDEVTAEDMNASEADKAAAAGAPAVSEFLRTEGEGAWEYAQRVYDLVYVRDVERVAGIAVLWEHRAPPTPLQPAAAVLGDLPEPTACEGTDVVKFLGLNPREDWSLEDTARVFMASVYAFHERRAADVGSASFTKDDPLAVAVVAAASNLRSHAYGIPRQPQFAAMGMAGNIIHAIATTNAVVAGLITLEATKLLSGCEAACRTTFLSGAIPNVYGKLTFASALRPPNPACLVCGHAVACVSLDMQTFTLQRLVEGVLKARMAFNHPMIVADDFLYEEGDDLEEDEVEENARHLPCALSALPGGLEHNARLHVTDQTQNMKLTLVLQQAILDPKEHPEGYVLEGSTPVAKVDEAAAAAAEPEEETPAPALPARSAVGSNGVIDILSDDEGGPAERGTKRKAGDDGAGPSSKAAKTDDVIELD